MRAVSSGPAAWAAGATDGTLMLLNPGRAVCGLLSVSSPIVSSFHGSPDEAWLPNRNISIGTAQKAGQRCTLLYVASLQKRQTDLRSQVYINTGVHTSAGVPASETGDE